MFMNLAYQPAPKHFVEELGSSSLNVMVTMQVNSGIIESDKSNPQQVP